MYTTLVFLTTLTSLVSALPNPTAVHRQTSTPACSAPTTFTVSQLNVFTPSNGNTNPATVSFSVHDNLGNGSFCMSTTTPNPEVPNACENANFEWIWDGKRLTVGDTYGPCGNSTQKSQVFGELGIGGLFCFPTTPPLPIGSGTLCQILPQGQADGQFTRSTLFPAAS